MPIKHLIDDWLNTIAELYLTLRRTRLLFQHSYEGFFNLEVNSGGFGLGNQGDVLFRLIFSHASKL